MGRHVPPTARMACAEIDAPGRLEAKYERMRCVLRVTTAARLSNLMRKVSIRAAPSTVPCRASARSRSMSTRPRSH
jgi:hypothetical protein